MDVTCEIQFQVGLPRYSRSLLNKTTPSAALEVVIDHQVQCASSGAEGVVWFMRLYYVYRRQQVSLFPRSSYFESNGKQRVSLLWPRKVENPIKLMAKRLDTLFTIDLLSEHLRGSARPCVCSGGN